MSKENDDFVEQLLNKLPKAEPISEIELRRFEKLIDRQAADYKQSRNSSRFRFPASIAASIAIVFGAAFVLTNNDSATSPTTSISKSGPAAESSGLSSSKGDGPQAPANTNSSVSSEGTSQESGVFGNADASNNHAGLVPIFNSNLDYSNELNLISKMVIVKSAPGDINSLQSKAQQCAIKLGVSKSLLAFDSGYFQDQRVQAYYSGNSKSDYKITLVDSDCIVVADL